MFISVAANAAMTALFGGGGGDAGSASCYTTGALTNGVSGYTSEQSANAATIVAIGKQMHVPEHGQVIAIATALQESGLRNLDHGDRDSLGLFQQRPSQGWGTPAQITNPAYAATAFYRRLLEVPGWHELSVNDAAQTVQRSATPAAYGQHEPAARALAAAVRGATCNPLPARGPAAAQAIAFAHAQIGQPYLWGGDGPEAGDTGFDCSGLTTAAYATAGIHLPRTAHTQYQATARVTETELRPGDLVFYGKPNTKIHHVGLYTGNGQMIDAPRYGKPVGIRPIRYQGNNFAGGGRVVRSQH